MKGFKKRMGILAVCLLLVCGLAVTASAAVQDCPGGCTHQAAVGTVHYDTLEEAISAAPADGCVTLLADVTADSPVIIEKPLMLDLGGKTLTGNVLFTKDGTVQNGKLLAAAGTALEVKDCTVTIAKTAQLEGCGTAPALAVTAGKDADTTVKVSGKISGEGTAPVIDVKSSEGSCELLILKGAQIEADTNPAIAFDSAGKLDISDGTIQTKDTILSLHFAEKRETEIAITGGKLLSEAGDAIVITADKKAEVPDDFVTGGTYRKVPSDYVPAYCKIHQNTDNTYTVISSYTITFQSGGASGSMAPVKVQCGSAYKLPQCGFQPAENMDFAGWQIGGKTYAAGDTYTPEEDVTVTALWKAHVHSGGKATCLQKAVCSGCGKTYGGYGSHNLVYTGGYAATCSSTGMNAHSKCSVCGSCFVNGTAVSASTLSTPALGHTWESVAGTPANCSEEGLKEHRKCTVCQLIQIDGSDATPEDLVIPATGHDLEQVGATQATCSEPGIQAHEHCSICDGQFVAGQPVEIAQLTTATASHVLSDWSSDDHYHWKACVDCQEVFRQSNHADTDGDGACDDCGYTMVSTPQEKAEEDKENFLWLFLIPLLIAIVVAVLLALKKRRNAQ